ncbi:hypothetical protein B0H14DRAFT_3910273 [Mycena olivaceomarginata]|nr:hypothetical protein B0H14DRAFT_3910273 [Mycena olivaceomarginata]
MHSILSASAPLPFWDEHCPLPTARRNLGNELKPKPKGVWLFGILSLHLHRDTARPPAHPPWPLFTNHATMNIDARHVRCPELGCDRYLPAPKKCLNGQNKDRYYVSCYNASHGPRIKLWALGVTPTVATMFPTPAANQPPPPPLASPNHPPPFPMPAARTPAHCLPHL